MERPLKSFVPELRDVTDMTRIAKAADRAATEVLHEDHMLHKYGRKPESRTR